MTPKSADLKRMARNALRGRWGSAIAVYILIGLMGIGLSSITSLFSFSPSIFSRLIYWIANVIVSLLTSLFSVGAMFFFLNICRGREARIGDIFAAFKKSPDRFLIVSLVTSSASILCVLPTYIWQPSPDQLLLYSLVTLGASFLQLFLSIIIALFFALAPYLLLEFPDMGALKALRMSAHLMKGSKGRYIYIVLSFVGWVFLSFFTGFISLLWILPYSAMTLVYFYADILYRYEQTTFTSAAPADSGYAEDTHDKTEFYAYNDHDIPASHDSDEDDFYN